MALFAGLSQSIADSRHYKWWVYVAIAIGMFVAVMNQTGIGIALPKIADHFDLDIPTVQWVLLGYILSTSAMFMPVGRLSDMVGRKRVYLTGFLVFIGASAVGGASPVFPLLIAANIVQGIGAAGVQACSMVLIIEAFPERERGKALGMFTTIIGSGIAGGPVIAGLLVSGFGWRSVFFANVPVGLIALAAVLVVVKGDGGVPGKGARRFNFDWVGAGLSSGALVSFLLGMTNAFRFGWGSPPILASFLIAPALLAAFIWWELHAADPILDLGFFRSKLFSTGVSARFLSFLGSTAAYFLMPFYLIQVLDYEAYIAGLLIVPSAICMAVSGPISGYLSDRFGARWLTVLGLALSASALFIYSRLDLDSSPAYIVVGMILNGLGMGIFSAPNTSAVASSQGREKYGIVSAFINLSRTSGNVVGIALATTIVTATMASLGYEPSLGAVSEAGDEGVKAAFVSGMSRAFLVSGGLVLLAMVVSGLQGRVHQLGPSFDESSRALGSLPHTTVKD